MLRRTAWIWAVGAAAWTFSGAVSAMRHNGAIATLDFIVAAVFLAAWMFYRAQRR